jgi:Flp pilus assembly pilin Flp
MRRSESIRRSIQAVRGFAARRRALAREERGQAMVEYALIIALVAAVAVVGLALIPNFPVRVFNSINDAFP